MALSDKAQGGKLLIVDSLELAEAKTKALVGQLSKMELGNRALFIDGDAVATSFSQASANIVGIDTMPAVGANVYDIIRADTLVLTRAAVEKLEARFNG
jgi:large subunit ribosomal protein L4